MIADCFDGALNVPITIYEGVIFYDTNSGVRRRGIHCFKLVKSNVMDEDFYDEMNRKSVVKSDEEIRPP